MQNKMTFKKSEIYDTDYDNKKQLSVYQSYNACRLNSYNPQNNPSGYVDFGTSINTLVTQCTKKYLPSYLKQQDFLYANPLGHDKELKAIVNKNTEFEHQETSVLANMYALLSQLCFCYNKVHIIGDHQQNGAILSHSQSQLVKIQDAQLIIIWYAQQNKIYQISKNYQNKMKLFVVKSEQQLKYFNSQTTKNNKIAIAYQYNEKTKLAVVFSHQKHFLKQIQHIWNFCPVNNIIRRAIINPQIQIQANDISNNNVRKMIQLQSGVDVGQDNIWVTMGCTGALDNLARAILKQNARICLDEPTYGGFDHFFDHIKPKFQYKKMLDGSKMIDRIKQAEKQGVDLYVVCNPHNPMGSMLEKQEVVEICEWVKNNEHFHIIFDEVYINTCREKQTKTSMGYSIKYQNIHTVRGFAKDTGICGLKFGFLISCNQNVKKRMKQWKNVISLHKYSKSILNQMLLKSNYGQEIHNKGRQILNVCFDYVFKELNKADIKYEKPYAGCFVMIDLRNLMKETTVEEASILWKKIFYKYRLSLTNGISLHTQPGFYRVCPCVNFEKMKEGLRRLATAVLDKEQQ